MGKGSFASFAAPAVESPAFLASQPLTVGPEGGLMLLRFVCPAPAFMPPFRDVSAHSLLPQVGQEAVVMIALVHDGFFNLLWTASQNQIGLRQTQGVGRTLRIGLVGEGDCRGHNGLSHHVHRVLSLVGQVRSPVLHLGNAAVRVGGALPDLIGDFLFRAVAVQPPQVFFRRVFDPVGFGQALEIFLPVFPGVFAHDGFHGGVGFQGGGVDGDGLAPQQALVFQQAQDPDKDLVIDRFGQALADDRHGGVDRRGFGQTYTQKGAQSQAVGAPPGDATLAFQTLEVAHQHHAKIDAGRDAGPSAFPVIRGAELLDELVKARLSQHLVELGVEGMPGAADDLRGGNEHLLLLGNAFANSHVHQTHEDEICSVKYTEYLVEFLNGLLGVHALLPPIRCGLLKPVLSD